MGLDNVCARKLEELVELDAFLPMIEAFHKTQEYCKLFPHSAYLLWLTFNFRSPTMGFWGMYEEVDGKEVPVGYIIVTIQDLHTVREALIYEAFSEVKYLDVKKEMLDEVEAWSRLNGCSLLSCYTENDKVVDLMQKRYGFKLNRSYLTKEI